MASSKNNIEEKPAAATTGEQNDDYALATTNGIEQGLLPHLESLERMMKFPVVEAAWIQSQDVYGKVKGKCSWIFL